MRLLVLLFLIACQSATDEPITKSSTLTVEFIVEKSTTDPFFFGWCNQAVTINGYIEIDQNNGSFRKGWQTGSEPQFNWPVGRYEDNVYSITLEDTDTEYWLISYRVIDNRDIAIKLTYQDREYPVERFDSFDSDKGEYYGSFNFYLDDLK